MNLKNKKIIFLGDSITQGVGVQNPDNIYWKRLENDGCIVRGYGISGTRIAKQQSVSENISYDKYFLSRVDEMDADADIVVVFGGTNDYGHGDAPIGKMSDRTDDTFYGALHNLMCTLKNKYNDAQIVFMTPCHRLEEELYYNSIGIRNVGTLKDYVDIICEVAAYYAIPVLDLYRNCSLQPSLQKNREKYMPDGLHPSDAGHQIIYSRLKGFLETL